MSYCSRHTTGKLPELGRYRETYAFTPYIFKGMSWKQLLAEDWDADGNTRFAGDKPTLAFIKNNLFLNLASIDLGYKIGKAHPKRDCNTFSIAKRIRTRGVGKLLPFLKALMFAELMPTNCSELLQKRRKPARLSVEFANEIIEASIKKQGSRAAALSKLGIDESLARWWKSYL